MIRIDHVVGQAHYATDYTNVGAIAPGVAPGQTILRGSPLGTAGTQTQFIGSSLTTWAMTHFQVNDFSRNEGLSNPNAVSPETVLSAAGRATFETIWQTAAYQTEWCEPFATNSRLAGFPIPRTWTIQSGSLPERLDVRCVMGGSLDHEYTFRDADGSPRESGSLRLDPSAKPLSRVDDVIDPETNGAGGWLHVDASMLLNLGAPRPSTLAGATLYATAR